MNFKREQIKDFYLLDTQVENIFINEYMASAPGDYVKVYLFALMYADLQQPMNNETVAKQLGLKEEDVLKAWSYWEGYGVIKKHISNKENKFDYQVEFINSKEMLYGKMPEKKKDPIDENTKTVLEDKDIQGMYGSIERITGKVINGTEMLEITSWINQYNAKPEVIIYAYSYCHSLKKHNVNYVGTVVKQWISKGLIDTDMVEKYLEENDQRRYAYKRIFKALGFNRKETQQEEKIMDTWFNKMDYSIEKVIEACGKTTGISNPNINYVNKVLTNWYEEKTGKSVDGKIKVASVTDVNKYYDYIAREAEEAAEERRRQVCSQVPRIREIEDEMNQIRMETSKAIISDRVDKTSLIESLKNKNQQLSQEKAILLTENNFEVNFMDVHYKCEICGDTGTTDDGERCECFPQRAKEAELWKTDTLTS
ncbi:MAG: DnaD domain protein [Anaerovoracaceae bacterium]